MTTYSELITQSLRSLGVIEGTDVASGNEASSALDTLNQMLHSFLYTGVDMEHTTGALSDTVPLPEDQIGPVRYVLAVHLAPEYGINPSPMLAALASDSMDKLRAAYADPDTLDMPDTLKAIFSPNNLFLGRL